MNCLKKTKVLNRHCLRTKIEELSPLLQNLSWGPNNDSLFRATWSYYASGCQEQLSSIRRRIEQNARIVAPTGGQKTQFGKDWTPTLFGKRMSKLPPGVDLEDHIYQEFVSCFRSEEGPAKVKSPKKQKELKPSGFPSPEEWLSWKREEEQVDQALKKSKDPYLKEELSKKLEQLNKLTSRRPLIVLPNQNKIPPPATPKKKSKRGLKSKEPLKKPGFASKPGPYVNRIPKTPRKSQEMGPISQRSITALTSFEKDHPSLETMDSIRHSFNRKHQPLKRREIHRHSAEYDNISVSYGIDPPRESVRKSQLDKASPSQAYDSKTSEKHSKKHQKPKASKKHLKAEISETENLKKSKSSMKNLTQKFSKIPHASPTLEQKAAAEAKYQGWKSKISDTKFSTLKDSLFLIPHFPKSPKKHIKEKKNRNEPFKLPEMNQRERSLEANQPQDTSSIRSGSSILRKSKLNEDLVVTHQLKRKSNSGRRRMSSIRKPLSWHSSVNSVLANKYNKKIVVLTDKNPQPVINLGVQLSEKKSTIFGRSLNAPGIPENNPRDQTHESSSSILQKTNYNMDSTITNPVKRKSSESTRYRIGSIKKPHSGRSSGTSDLGYIPFKASMEKKERIPHKEYVPELTFTEPAAKSTLSVHRGSRQSLRQESSHGWPLPVGLQRHQEYVSPFGQYKNQREEEKPMEKKGQEKKNAEINLNKLRRPSESVTVAEAKRRETFSLSPSKISAMEPISMENVQPNQPMIIADIKAEFMESYGSKISFMDTYSNLLKPNELDRVAPEIPLEKPQVKKVKAGKIKLKKTKVEKTKEEKTKENKIIEMIPSKRKTEPCSLCNLVRRRQSELRPYMQRMQEQRHRMELKAYYTQKILKKQGSPEARRPCAQQVLTRCYWALSICQRLLEQRRLQKSQECQP